MSLNLYFQASTTLSTFRNRGRAYKCNSCGKVLRRYRMTGHVLKQHVPLDRVAYHCTLCLFRCQDKDTLVDHIQKYKRHQEAEVKLGQPVDYTQILRRAERPIIVGDQHMTALSKEESLRWHARNSIALAEEDPFAEEEDDVVIARGLALPSWAVTKPTSVTKVPVYEPTPINTLASSNLGMTYPSLVPAMTHPVATAVTATVTCHTPSFSTINYDSLPDLQVLQGPFPIANTAENNKSGSNHHPSSSAGIPPTSYFKNLNTPEVQATSTFQTPCLDENILTDLVAEDPNDPLLNEARAASPTNQPSKEDHGEPKAKRRREGSGCNPSDSTSQNNDVNDSANAIAKAISEGFKRLSDAMDCNTRAIRCQEKVSIKAVEELGRIERKLAQIERAMSISAQTPITPKENRPPATTKPILKSTVRKM